MASRADPGTRAATADPGTREAMADRGAREAMADRGAWEASMVGSPPKKITWGNSSQGGAQEAPSLGVLLSRTESAGALVNRT